MMVADFGEYALRIDSIIEEGDSLTPGDARLDFEITPGLILSTSNVG